MVSIFHSLNTSASALTAQRMRMDVISSNMANIDTTRGKMVDGEWEPYRRKTVTLQPKEGQFSSMLNTAMGKRLKDRPDMALQFCVLMKIPKRRLISSLTLDIPMRMTKGMWKCRMSIHFGKWST